ncbi:DMT family transporter [Aneurinibacillus terranovensis]|uniref:DMT family transporter n=1 Tax=Aneurinibacillus terranovensis TaxID=278991 RepID=UPI0004175C82|nr:DMT family transporter [Aneurinibacillus terranovensis]
MMKFLFTLLTVVSGVGLSVQAAINGRLGRAIGTIEAAFVSFFVGTIALLIAVLFFGKGNVIELFTVPKWKLLGGLIGATYIAVLAMVVPKIGVGASVVSVICGQIIMSMLIDHFGWFNGPKIPFNTYRFIGLLFLIVALILISRGSIKSG